MIKLILLLQDAETTNPIIGLIIGVAIIFGFVFLIRLFGAWMLRINDVVNELEKVNRKLTNIEKKLDKDSE